MLDHNQLDDVSMVNFDAATLRMTKEDDDAKELKDAECVEDNLTNASKTKKSNVPIVPFKHIDVHTFFSDRNEVVERAINDCKEALATDQTDEIIGVWLLTEISLWDTEKERVVLLTRNGLYTIKYDFISLRILEFHRISLKEVDTVAYGELEYPTKSIVPRLNGIAEGISSMINHAVRQDWSALTSRTDINFEPRMRNLLGVRVMWNKGKSLSFDKKWNPFAKRVPVLTFTSHPLFWHKGSNEEKSRFDIETFQSALTDVLPDECSVIKTPLMIENYVGLGALLHNRHSLGFFKVRGKISF